MIVLGVESSCDETGLALYDTQKGLIAHELYSQAKLHAQYGGVVPELASRDHIRCILPLLKQLLSTANIAKSDIDGVAYTVGPGLVGALLVGACFGRSLAWALAKPAIGVHHLEGHLLAPMLEKEAPEFPFLALLISGGHCILVNVLGLGDYKVLGETLDDAIGEAFDKTAKLLGLSYPGGPQLEQLAKKGDASGYQFPRPMTNRPGLDFSFSGLKTFTLKTWQRSPQDALSKANIAAAFQVAVADTLAIKCKRAIKECQSSRLVISGGVGANLFIRGRLKTLTDTLGVSIYYPRLEFCTDNGAMIAFAGHQRLVRGERIDSKISVFPRRSLQTLTPPQVKKIAN